MRHPVVNASARVFVDVHLDEDRAGGMAIEDAVVLTHALDVHAAYLDAPNNRRSTNEEKINYRAKGVDRPRSFRDDVRVLAADSSIPGLELRTLVRVRVSVDTGSA